MLEAGSDNVSSSFKNPNHRGHCSLGFALKESGFSFGFSTQIKRYGVLI
jgi:hypothetical protein